MPDYRLGVISIDTIERRTLGNTDIELTLLGYGCASVWGKKLISDEQAKELFEAAYDLGIRYFDTGYSYGCAEQRIGSILKRSERIRREDLIISTKFGTKNVNGKYIHDFSPEWMHESVATSLERMGTGYIDLLLVHGPAVSDLTEAYIASMNLLKERGLVKAIGINTFDDDVLEYVCDTRCFDFVMLDYNILKQEREEIIEKLYRKGIGIIAGAPLAESLYSNRVFKIRKVKDLWYLARAIAKHRKELSAGRKFRFINDIEGMTGSQIALKYVTDNPYVTSAVFGSTSIEHLKDNVNALQVTIPPEVKDRIRDVRFAEKRKR